MGPYTRLTLTTHHPYLHAAPSRQQGGLLKRATQSADWMSGCSEKAAVKAIEKLGDQ